MNLKFFGGIDTIGGNKVLIEDQDSKVFLDFGMNFSEHAKYFEEFLKPRTGNGFGDWLALGMLPHPSTLPGIYRNDLLQIAGIKESEPEIDAVLASHIHYDHTADISFVHEKIPIYASEITIAMAKALIDCGNRTIGTEVFNYLLRDSDGKSAKQIIERKWNPIKTEKKFKIGSLEILPLAVDHSVPGAMAFLIYTSEGTILYSGDLRLHGTYGNLTKKMTEIASSEGIDLFLCEGTRLGEMEIQSEQKVQTDSTKVIQNTNGLVLADYGFKDVTRFQTFYEIAKNTNRKFVIGLKDAYLLQQLEGMVESLPSVKDEYIEIHKRKLLTTPKPLRPLLEQDNVITSEEINKNQNEKIVRLGFWEITELIDLQPKTGSQYIHSSCEPFNEEMEINQERLNNWIDYFHLKKHQIHCSGHAPQQDIKTIIQTIKPKKLTPIHTVMAKKFEEITPKETKIEYAKSL